MAHYAFDETSGTTAADSSGNNLHGTVTGASWTNGRIDGGLLFDGQDDRVDLGSIDISGSALTLMAWINIANFTGTSSDGRIISKATSTAEDGHYWMLSTISSGGTKLRFRLKTGGTTTTLIGGDVTTGEWIHAAAVYDGQEMRIYKNGIAVASVAKTGSISENNSIGVWIGDQPPTAGTRPWDGIIDDVRIYESALTEQEIQFAMNNGNAFPSVTLVTPVHNQQFASGETINLSATASDSDGTIQVVEFYEGSTKIGEDFTQPYNSTWDNVPDGSYQITAKAIDNEGSYTISTPAHQITVGSGGPPADWVHKSTENGFLDLPTASGNSQTASLVLDINGDGITDFVITDRSTGPSVVWYESSDQGSWQRRVIEPDQLPIEAGGTFTDIDGDGDLDLVFGGDGGSNLTWWWENPNPDFQSRWTRRYIKNSGSNKYHDQMFGDYDGDGDDELASWNQGASQLILFEIPQDPKNTEPWPYSVIAQASSSHEGMAAFDVNGNGALDIVGAGRWYSHTGGGNYAEHLVDASQTYGRSAAGQFVPGGYAELVFGPGDSSGDLKFYQYDGNGGWDVTLIKQNVDHGHSLHTADFNGDGHLDIFCAEMRLNGGNSDAKTWIFYGDGAGNFSEEIVAEGFGNHESRPADLDGDGDIDILGKPYNWDAPRLDIWLNHGTGPALRFDLWQRHLIDSSLPANAVFIKAGDLNGDNHTDLIGGGWWWQNPGQFGGQWIRHEIGSSLNNMALVYDLDNDNDLDILGTTGVGSSSSHTFRWARNNGLGSFTIYDNIDTGGTGDFLQGSLVDDFGNGQEIALSWHNMGGGVHSLAIPGQPHLSQWPFATLSATTQGEDLSSGDIDRDGDKDLLLGTIWLENDIGSWTAHTIGQVTDLHPGAEPDRNDLADIDGDGRLDAVIGLENGTSLLWFKAPADPTGSWQRNIIGTVAGQGFSMDTADFDGDGDPDVVVGEHRGSVNNRVIIFENRENGASWTEHIIDNDSTAVIDHHDGTQAVDLDNDGDLDIISVGWYNKKVWIYENRSIIDGGPGSPPTITLHPAGTTVTQGQRATLSVTAAGSGPISYQWRLNGVDLPFATNPTLETWPLSMGDDNSIYSCVVSNSYGKVVSNDASVAVNTRTGTPGWWDKSWKYRIPLTIDPDGSGRREFPVVKTMNFTTILASLGQSAPFDPNSLRVVEVTSAGVQINKSVSFQFDKAADYNGTSNASGELTFILHGQTGPAETRYFHIYFDIMGSVHPPATVDYQIALTSGLQHKGWNSLQIDTDIGSWFYHMQGAGFATLIDSQGKDWIGFVNNSGSAASGWYRGIPNAIYPEDMMHPGRTGCQSSVTHEGPIRVTIASTCGNWQGSWDIFPAFARMTMEAHDHDYWFQYEGTPGGSTEADDFIVTPDGTTTTAANEWTQDIAGNEWVYLGDNNIDRTIFVAHQELDTHSERFYRMEGGGGDGMTIFAFGRGSGTTTYLNSVPRHFTIGLLETKDHAKASAFIAGNTESVLVTQGVPQGVALPVLDESDVYFGTVQPGFQSDRTITLSNNGSADLEIGTIGLVNPIQPPFYVVTDNCSGKTLAPGQSCTIIIGFLPPDLNSYSDSFDIPTNGVPPSLTVYIHSGFKPFPWILFVPAVEHRQER